MASEEPRPAQKLTQAEMLERMSPAPFDQRNIVPKHATVKKSPDGRWWRSDSPVRDGEPEDRVSQDEDFEKKDTRGVLGFGQRTGPSCFQSQYQTGSGTAAHFKNEGAPPTISGYSGHIPGKYAGNVVGGTYTKTNSDAQDHLTTTAQTSMFGTQPVQYSAA
mmetsp:Transcript_118329/g.205540  ORF Transcript_118329/g.205540 Transcript_118329/m.205540 type:complete len:162 (+) Transcript_118329:53-538(+)